MRYVLGFLLALSASLGPSDATAQTAVAQAQRPAEETVTLQPGDVVRVQVWREESLSGEFPVDEQGIVTFPLLGERQINDIPISRLRDDLLEEYRHYLRNPSISIVPLRKVLVLGEVGQPGPYEVDPTESILGVIAQAGGPNSSGNLRRLRVVRDGEVIIARAQAEASLAALNLRSGDQLIVPPRNWFARNQSLIVSMLLALPGTIFTVTRILE